MCKYINTKNILAPLLCIERNNQPHLGISRIIASTLKKAVPMSQLYLKANKRPLAICKTKHTPNNDPKFHI